MVCRLSRSAVAECRAKATRSVPGRRLVANARFNTMTSRWAYACSKALDEFLALAHGRQRQLPVMIVRLFNTAGPRQTGRLRHGPPAVRDTGAVRSPAGRLRRRTQRRCSVMSATSSAHSSRLIAHAGAARPVVNVGSEEEVTIDALARAGARAHPEPVGDRADSICGSVERGLRGHARRVPDLTRARALIGFAPTTRLDDIIMRVIEHERAFLRLRHNALIDTEPSHRACPEPSRRALVLSLSPDSTGFRRFVERHASRIDWPWVLQRAQAHKIAALLAARVEEDGPIGALDADVARRMQEVRQEARRRTHVAQSTLERLARSSPGKTSRFS